MEDCKPTFLVFSRSDPLRAGLRAFLGQLKQASLVGDAATVPEARALVVEHQPTLIVLDMYLEHAEALELFARLKSEHPALRWLAIADGADQARLARANGIEDVLLWGFSPRTLTASVERLAGADSRAGLSQPGNALATDHQGTWGEPVPLSEQRLTVL